jgi:hypothetical protein
MRDPIRVAGLVCLLALFASVPVTAVPICDGCLLGIFDDAQLTKTAGNIGVFEVKTVYLGLRQPAGLSIGSLQFEASYPGGFTPIDYTSYVQGAKLSASATSVRVEWPQCVTGTRVLFRLRFLSFGSVRDAVVQLRNAEATACSGSNGDRWLLPTGCYVLNPSRGSGCTTGVKTATWAGMKELFK